MISTEEALKLVLGSSPEPKGMAVPLDLAIGEVLQEDLFADRDFPPYNRVAIDGIALHSDTWKKGRRSYKVAGTQASGAKPFTLDDNSSCLEIMTGAVLPKGCDVVVRYEDLVIKDGWAKVVEEIEVKPWMNVHLQGMDQKAGDLICKKGRVLLGPQIAVAASIGKETLLVSAKPRVSILSTGDELVKISETPEPHQIRASNSHVLSASLRNRGLVVESFAQVGDDRGELKSRIEDALRSSDVLILTGGVSKGKFDFVPELLEECGVKKVFHKVAQKPGKPIWFGVKRDGKVVFGLPGNPVAVLVCFHKYVLPFVNKFMGRIRHRGELKLAASIRPKRDLTHFIPVSLKDIGTFEQRGVGVKNNGSGDLTSLVYSDGFVELKPEQFDADPQILDWFPWDER